MEFQDLEDFLALARSGSFRRAAEVRNVTQPAFSRRIKGIEDRLGTDLFDRSQTPIALTPAGMRMFDHAQNLSRSLTQALEDARSTVSALNNPIRIVTTHTLAVSFFPAWWKDALRKMGSGSVRLTGSRIEQCVLDLRETQADFAIIHNASGVLSPGDLSGLQAVHLGDDALLPVIAKHKKGQTNDLLSYAPGSFLGQCVAGLMAGIPARVAFKTVFESPSSEVLRAMALTGFGTAFLPKSLIEDDLLAEYLVPALPAKHQMKLDILLLRLPARLSMDAEMLWDSLKRGSR